MKILGKIIATISVLYIIPFAAFAYQDSSRIGASVKISVCGDTIVEGKEECEQGLGTQYDCKDFGYIPQKIGCDISCAYDLLSCKSIKAIENTNKDNKEPVEEPSLPILMIGWDQNSDGQLTVKEFTSFITNWVTNWKSFIVLPKENTEKETVAKECDINSDKTCNITDFSIILYYLNSND